METGNCKSPTKYETSILINSQFLHPHWTVFLLVKHIDFKIELLAEWVKFD
jgi:hypothetical protein